MANILILHGPNLNLLGSREPERYGDTALSVINANLTAIAEEYKHALEILQSNSESTLIERIQKTRHDKTDFIIFNPAAFTHTSIALRDALLAVSKPFIEVHLTNIYKRETFRQNSYFSDIAQAVICGFGPDGYLFALRYAHYYLTEHTTIRSDIHYGYAKNTETH